MRIRLHAREEQAAMTEDGDEQSIQMLLAALQQRDLTIADLTRASSVQQQTLERLFAELEFVQDLLYSKTEDCIARCVLISRLKDSLLQQNNIIKAFEAERSIHREAPPAATSSSLREVAAATPAGNSDSTEGTSAREIRLFADLDLVDRYTFQKGQHADSESDHHSLRSDSRDSIDLNKKALSKKRMGGRISGPESLLGVTDMLQKADSGQRRIRSPKDSIKLPPLGATLLDSLKIVRGENRCWVDATEDLEQRLRANLQFNSNEDDDTLTTVD